jgi:hypothetical protein
VSSLLELFRAQELFEEHPRTVLGRFMDTFRNLENIFQTLYGDIFVELPYGFGPKRLIFVEIS